MKEMVVQSVYQIVGIILMLGATALGIWAKNLAKKWINNDTKRQLAEYAVMAVEQVYKSLHGKEKLSQAMAIFSQQLSEKNIYISEDEMHLLLEAAVGKFNDVFNKKDEPTDDTADA